MARTYLAEYPAVLESDIDAFEDPKTFECSLVATPWARWKLTETARRTIFVANLLNFHNNRDCTTGKQLPYYESLNEDIILNMPLPCSHAAWTARSEEGWKTASKRLNKHPGETTELGLDRCLKDILSKYTQEVVSNRIGEKFGFNDSDELRNLIILSAFKQFGEGVEQGWTLPFRDEMLPET